MLGPQSSPRRKRRLKVELRSLNFRIFMLIFISVVVVIAILKERSDLNWLASVPLSACLDYALPQSTADNADLSIFFVVSRFLFLSDSLIY